MSVWQRLNRPGGVATTPHEVRLIAFISVGWSVFFVLSAVYFGLVLAPAVGETMDLHMTGKKGSFDIHVVTGVLAVVSFWLAATLVLLAVVAALVSRTSVRLAHIFAGIVCFVAPFYLGVVLPNAWLTIADPARHSGLLLFGAGVIGFVGLIIGALSFTVGPAAIDSARENIARRRITPGYKSPLGREES